MTALSFSRFMQTHECDDDCRDWTYEQHRKVAFVFLLQHGVRLEQ